MCSIFSGDVSNCPYRLKAESISCYEFAFQLGLAIFLYAKNIKNLGEIGWVARVFISMTLLPDMNASRAVGHGWSQMNSANLYVGGDSGVCACVLVHACAHVHGHACVRDVFAIYDNNI